MALGISKKDPHILPIVYLLQGDYRFKDLGKRGFWIVGLLWTVQSVGDAVLFLKIGIPCPGVHGIVQLMG